VVWPADHRVLVVSIMLYAAQHAERPRQCRSEQDGIMSFVEERFGVTGRIALVTGSRQGIGRTLASGLARAGATVVLNGRDQAALEIAAEELRSDGHTVHTAAFDVTDAEASNEAVKRIEADIGPIDILVNNAGIQIRAPIAEFDLGDWDRLLATNVTSVFQVGRAVAAGMTARQRGKIINICSVQSELARPTIAPYAASKGAVKMLTKAMCAEWAGSGIQVNGLGPGYYVTPLTQALVDDPEFDGWLRGRVPAGRWGDPEDLVGATIFLASAASDYVNGHILYVDGGLLSVI
jgi:gluconate 5-dehydrogenase